MKAKQKEQGSDHYQHRQNPGNPKKNAKKYRVSGSDEPKVQEYDNGMLRPTA